MRNPEFCALCLLSGLELHGDGLGVRIPVYLGAQSLGYPAERQHGAAGIIDLGGHIHGDGDADNQHDVVADGELDNLFHL